MPLKKQSQASNHTYTGEERNLAEKLKDKNNVIEILKEHKEFMVDLTREIYTEGEIKSLINQVSSDAQSTLANNSTQTSTELDIIQQDLVALNNDFSNFFEQYKGFIKYSFLHNQFTESKNKISKMIFELQGQINDSSPNCRAHKLKSELSIIEKLINSFNKEILRDVADPQLSSDSFNELYRSILKTDFRKKRTPYSATSLKSNLEDYYDYCDDLLDQLKPLIVEEESLF